MQIESHFPHRRLESFTQPEDRASRGRAFRDTGCDGACRRTRGISLQIVVGRGQPSGKVHSVPPRWRPGEGTKALETALRPGASDWPSAPIRASGNELWIYGKLLSATLWQWANGEAPLERTVAVASTTRWRALRWLIVLCMWLMLARGGAASRMDEGSGHMRHAAQGATAVCCRELLAHRADRHNRTPVHVPAQCIFIGDGPERAKKLSCPPVRRRRGVAGQGQTPLMMPSFCGTPRRGWFSHCGPALADVDWTVRAGTRVSTSGGGPPAPPRVGGRR
jgi:hypothetical protein